MAVSNEELYSHTTVNNKSLPDKCQNFLIPEIFSLYIKVKPNTLYVSEFVENKKKIFQILLIKV